LRDLIGGSFKPVTVPQPTTESLQFGHLRIFPQSRTIQIDGQGVELTTPQYDLLEVLVNNPGEVLSRQQILSQTRGIDYDGYSRTVDILISQLRSKLNRGSGASQLIKTARNKGYLFAVPAA